MAEMISYGIRYSFSVFYLRILEEFRWSRAGTAGIFSIHTIAYGLMAPLSGTLADKFGPKKLVPLGTLLITISISACSAASEMWHFYILFGAVFSVGLSISGWPQFAPVLAEWFVRRRATALGVAVTGFGLCFLVSSLAEFLILNLGLRGAFIALGMLPTLIIAPLAVLFIQRRPEDVGLSPDGFSSVGESSVKLKRHANEHSVDDDCSPARWTLAKAVGTRRFWMIFFANFCVWGVGLNMILAHQVAFVHDIGYSEVFAASVLSLYGVLYSVGNLFGFVSDRLGREKTVTLGSIGAVAAMLLLVTTRDATSPWRLYAYSVLFGFCMGLSSPALNALPADLFQGRSFGAINGLLMLGFGIGGSLGPWIGGHVFDTMGTYLPAFSVAILAFVVACALVWVAAPRRVRPLKT